MFGSFQFGAKGLSGFEINRRGLKVPGFSGYGS